MARRTLLFAAASLAHANASGCTRPVADRPLATEVARPAETPALAGPEVVLVGLVDAGSLRSPGARALLAVNELEAAGAPGVDDDGDGFVDDVHGLPLYPSSSPSDLLTAETSVNHAERVLAEMAAVWRSSPPARAVRVVAALELPTAEVQQTPEGGVLTEAHTLESGLVTTRVAQAIDAFAARGVRVVNLSMNVSLASTRAYFRLVGAPTDADGHAERVYGQSAPALRAAVARHPEMLFVVAAGNSGVDLDAEESAPLRSAFAEAGGENVLVVTAVDCDPVADGECPGRLRNHGERSVHLCVRARSTSLAAPRASAVAAALLAGRPDLSTAALRAALLARAREVPALRGLVEAGRFLSFGDDAAAGSFR